MPEEKPVTLLTLSDIYLALHFHFTCSINHWKRLNEIPISVCFYRMVTKITETAWCVSFFFLPLHLSCLLPVFLRLSSLDGDMYAIIFPFFMCMLVISLPSKHQSRKKEPVVIYVSRKRTRRGEIV